jgi:4-carboxymuconolactone decarboxylase
MKATISENSIFPKGQQGSPDWFTGTVWVTPLLAKDKNNDFSIGNVVFEPDARTHWHTHPRGQVLLVTEGNGFYQEQGKPARSLKKGDVMNIPENTVHWHGASANSLLAHIAITNYKGSENVSWLKPVTDHEYSKVNE